MPYSSKPEDYEDEELRKVAIRHFVDRRSFEYIANELSLPRAKVAAMCEAARRKNMVHIVVDPTPRMPSDRLRELAVRIREKFELLECIVVNGRPEMLQVPKEQEAAKARELQWHDTDIHAVIIDDLTGRAAEQLVFRFRQQDKPCLAVTFGLIARKVANNVLLSHPPQNKEGFVLAAQGIRRLEQDRFDTGDLVRDLARDFGCEHFVMPVPALIEKEYVRSFCESALVKEILKKLEDTNIVFSSLGGFNQRYEDRFHPSLNSPLIPEGGIEWVKSHGAVGNLGGWWFDINGNSIEYEKHVVLGLGLKLIQNLVENRLPVILAVGADTDRIPALAAALTCKRPLGNIWIGDEITARVLLGEIELAAGLTYTESQKEAIQKAVKYQARSRLSRAK